jgi:hypothetical protein
LPARGDVKEIEVDGGGDNGDLKKVEDAEQVERGGGVVVGGWEKHHEDGSSPDEEQKIGRPGNLRRAGDERLVIGADGLSDGFERQSDREKSPELAGVAGGTASDVEGGNGGQEEHGEVQGVGEKKAFGGGMNELQIEDEQNSDEDRGSDGEAGKLAGREQGASVKRSVGASVHEKDSSYQEEGIGNQRSEIRKPFLVG